MDKSEIKIELRTFFQKEQNKNLLVANEDTRRLLNDLKVDKLKL